MEKTIIQLKAELQEIALKHKQINGFFFGQFNDAFSLEEKLLYPVMICQLLPGSMTKKNVQTSVSIAILDKIKEEDFDQQTEVLSDCQQICADIKNIFSSYRFEDYTFEDNSITLDPIIEERSDLVSGWVMNFTIDSFDSQDYCSIPIEDYDFENSPFVDCSTGSLPVPTDCPTASVSNSDDSFTASVVAGGSLELTDIDLNVNGALFDTYPSVQDVGLTVKNEDGIEVGSKIGNDYVVPSGSSTNKINYYRPIFNGQKTSYADYDTGWRAQYSSYYDVVQEGGKVQQLDYEATYPFATLKYKNIHGNYYRFMTIDGNQDWLDYDTFVDHLTGELIVRDAQATLTQSNAMITAYGLTLDGETEFFVPDQNMMYLLLNLNSSNSGFEWGDVDAVGNTQLISTSLTLKHWTSDRPPIVGALGPQGLCYYPDVSGAVSDRQVVNFNFNNTTGALRSVISKRYLTTPFTEIL